MGLHDHCLSYVSTPGLALSWHLLFQTYSSQVTVPYRPPAEVLWLESMPGTINLLLLTYHFQPIRLYSGSDAEYPVPHKASPA